MTQYREAKALSARPLVSTQTTRLQPLLHLRPPHHLLHLSQLLHRPQVWDPTIRNGLLERCFITLLAFSFFPLSFPKVKQ